MAGTSLVTSLKEKGYNVIGLLDDGGVKLGNCQMLLVRGAFHDADHRT